MDTDTKPTADVVGGGRTAALLGVAAILMAGCSNGPVRSAPTPSRSTTTPSVSPSPSVDHAAVDAVFDRVASGVRALRGLRGSRQDILAQYRLAESDFQIAARALWPSPPTGVPTGVAREVSAALTATADAVAALRACYETAQSTTDCEHTADALGDKAEAAGTETADLAPYSSRSAAELAALLRG